MDNIKSFLVAMGVGFAFGCVVTASNKRVLEIAKQAKQMAEEKYEMAKEGVIAIKDKIEENQEKEQNIDSLVKNKKQTKKA